ncbi:MAG: ribosome biogenesis GTP-binding protein YihA/YsxC [Pyrinomonadaceae bacterium]
MKITSAEFLKSAFERRHWPLEARREVAFLGRSNVGKSSLLNSLLQRKALARTSNTPGRTQSINFFLINAKYPIATAPATDKSGFYFVDLPGYGYAKVSKSMRADWGKMAEEYLSDRERLALCIQLVDSRHKPSPLDLQLHEWLTFNEKRHIVVATKSDKLSSSELSKQLRLIGAEMPESKVIPYSSQTGKGRDVVWSEIAATLA